MNSSPKWACLPYFYSIEFICYTYSLHVTVKLTANPTNLYFGRGFFVVYLRTFVKPSEACRLSLEKRSVRLCRVIATLLGVIN